MSALDLDALEARCKDTIAEWTLVYAQSGETLPDDAVETKAARETLALITRLRAAEARTAWQPIETAPLWPDRSPTPLWIVGQRVARSLVTVAQTAPGVYVDEYSNRQHVTAWAPLPAAPEAP